MARGDIVIVALSGDYGKPRPALVVQADILAEIPTLLICPLTSELVDAPLVRIDVAPGDDTGLRRMSQIMVDKTQAIRREKIGQTIGKADAATIAAVDDAIAYVFGLATGSGA